MVHALTGNSMKAQLPAYCWCLLALAQLIC